MLCNQDFLSSSSSFLLIVSVPLNVFRDELRQEKQDEEPINHNGRKGPDIH